MSRILKTIGLMVCMVVIVRGWCRAAEEAVGESLPVPGLEAEKVPEPEHTTPLHFVGDLNVNNYYYTPRGLLVSNKGVSFHLLALAILDVYKNSQGPITGVSLIGGFWNNFLTDYIRSPYNEVDPILSIEATVYKNFTLGATYVPFISPPNLFPGGTEHNMEFKLAYDDTDLLGPFAMKPYFKPFWHFSGPSPVVLGGSDAWDFELGISPSFTTFKETDTPLKVTFPFFMAMGNSVWYGGPGTFVGHVAPGANLSIPLTKWWGTDYGIWSIYVAGQYSRILNNNLLQAGTILTGNTDKDVWVGTGGIAVFVP